MTKPLEKQLESILTIDGQGRPAKARQLLELLATIPLEELKAEVEKIGQRKFF
jgi:hypothetical protein